MKEIELIGKRKAREKHFLKQNGVIEAQVFDEDIHFLKNGIYEEIDNTLIDKGDYYTNKNNAYEVKLYKDTSDNLMEVSIDDKFIKTRLLNPNLSELTENIMESKTHKNVCYSNILDNIDLEYNILPTKVKEAIILKNKNACVEKLVFSIETNMKLSLLENKKIIAERDGVQIFEFDAPYMIDNEFKINNNVSYELTECDSDEYLLKIKIDEEWLQDENTKCPVMIDPTITNSGQNNSVYDTYIYPGDTNIDRNSQDILKVGVERVNGVDIINRSLIKFELPTIGTGSQIISASIDIYGYPETPHNYNTDWITIHQITSSWDETNANWNAMNDKYNPLVEGIIEAGRGYYDFENQTIYPAYCWADITRLVRKWYTGTPNNGLMLKLNEEKYNPDVLPSFYSKNNSITGENPKPLLTISYRNQNGLLDYMDYQTQDFVFGNAYVNSYNGNLTTIFDIGSTSNGKMPVDLKLVYNTNDVILENDYGYGLGYKFNLHQTIMEQPIDGKTYLEYSDEDGTLHYFLNQKTSFDDNGYNTIDTENIYYDEEGLNMTITKIDTNYILKDKNGNTMKFVKDGKKAYLTEIEDVSGNKSTIEYSPEHAIVKITDANNNEINLEYDITTISIISSSQTTILNYLNNQVDSIYSPMGEILFEYNENKIISKTIDANGIKNIYKYYDQKPYKLKSISEYGTENTLGKNLNLFYGFDSTTIIDHKGRAKNIVFNSQGSVVSISGLKEKKDINNAYGISQINGTAMLSTNNGSNNKLLRTEIPLKYVNNLLSNTSFEKNEIRFTNTENVDMTISNEAAETGSNSLKATSTSSNQELTQTVNVQKGEHYTFSAYIKNTGKTKLKLSYIDSDNTIVESISEIISSSSVFERLDVTLKYPESAISDLYLKICLDECGTTYIDDIQLELGEVANNYNLIENSDFSSGLTDWELSVMKNGESILTDGYFDIVNITDQIKALRVKANPVCETIFSRTFNISGKGGDVFNLSFWYKNEGIDSNLSEYYGSRAYVSFNYINQDDGHCGIPSPILNPNDDAWQYISNDFIAEKDYNSITVDFHREYDANNLYITNLSLFKDIRNVYYEYDEFGNVILENNLDNKSNNFNYDNSNQLIQMTNTKGKSFSFEYDNTITDRVINGISDMGISNKAKYDINNNPIFTKIIKDNIEGDIINGLYKIRLKGSEKYLRNISNEIKVKSEDCNHDKWLLEKYDEYFRISHSIINDKHFTVKNNLLMLSNEIGDNTLFKLNKNKNGSYTIKIKQEDKYLKYGDQGIEISTLVDDDYHFEFYFETVDCDEFIENSAEYSDDGRSMESTTDTLGNKTYYNINPVNGLKNSETNALGQTISYTYNYQRQLTNVSNGEEEASYIYNDRKLLSKIKHGKKDYNYFYNEFSNIQNIKIGNNTNLINFNYEDKNGNLISYEFGNRAKISGKYDEFDRIIEMSKEDEIYYHKYDNNGNLVKTISNSDITKYTYDLSKRLSEYRYNDFKIKYEYDSNENIIKSNYKLNDTTNEISNIYNDDDLIVKTNFDNDSIDYTYDKLGRIVGSNINNNFVTKYEYVSNGKKTSYLTKSIKNDNDLYSYKYNKLNNITHIYHNGILENKYYYDYCGKLEKEKNYLQGLYIKYKYDNVGNILSRKVYDLNNYNLISKNNYKYQNNEWEDQLTKFNDANISYDEIGNPINIGNHIQLSWINGRELRTYNDENTSVTYKYGINGIRTAKKVNNIETIYYLEGNDIALEKTGNNVLYYLRNNVDGLFGFRYNNKVYYYIKNAQDDVIGILDEDLNKIAKYRYDSWGNIISITDNQGNDISNNNFHIANINPYRYRSYYYDRETGLYYLNSRYYNPEWGRFISADITTGECGGNILSHNMYQYAFNDPINYDDSNGNWPKWLKKSIKKIAIGAAVVAVGAIVTVATGGAALPAIAAGVKAALVAGTIAGTIRMAKSLAKSSKSKKTTTKSTSKSTNKNTYKTSSNNLKDAGKSFIEGFADGFMYGGIMAGGSQVVSGAFKIATKLGVPGGRGTGISLGNNVSILSPDKLTPRNIHNGGTLIKFGDAFRIDVSSNNLLHFHMSGVEHIPFGPIISGLFGGIK